MTELKYHLEIDKDLIVSIDAPYRKESLFALAKTPSERRGLELLIKEEVRRDNKAISFQKMHVSTSLAFDVLKCLGATGRLFWRGKKIVVDPFTLLKNGSVKAQDCQAIFRGDPSWVLKHGIIQAFEEGGDVEEIVPAPEKIQEPIPFLKLTDRHGAFADLWFDYGTSHVAFHDPKKNSSRNPTIEKSWEKDLLETDFHPKVMETSHYYCPLNKVAKSLTFLIEMGWPVLDHKGRRVLKQKNEAVKFESREEKIIVHATFDYEDHQADLKDVIGAFNRREQFIELSPSHVALLDRDGFEEKWGDLCEHEVVVDGVALKKNQVGLLDPFLEKSSSKHPPLIQILEDLKLQVSADSAGVPSSFQGNLFPYQEAGFQWLHSLYQGSLSGLLADEMGLGKTVQVLAFLAQLSGNSPTLIVVPTSLLFNWQREMEKFLPTHPFYVHSGKDRLTSKEELQKHSLIFTSYSLLRIDAHLFEPIHYQCIILDESQTIKNPDSQIADLCCKLNANMRLAITGTPIENRADDLWSLFHFLMPDLLGDRKVFQSQITDARYLQRIRRKIHPFILRRTKIQVAIDLPPKLEQVVWVDMTESQQQMYERWLQSTKRGLLQKIDLEGGGKHRMEILEAILRLRQLCAHPFLVEGSTDDTFEMSAKFDRLFQDLAEVVSEGRKVLVYSQFTQMLQLIEAQVRLKSWKYVYLDGSTKDREKVVRQFQDDPETSIFLISLKAGGVGLNLTAADYVFLYDPWWNEAVENQAIDRAHRVGKQGTVIARRYVTALSIEEKILRLKAHKKSLSQGLLDGTQEVDQLSLDELIDLLK